MSLESKISAVLKGLKHGVGAVLLATALFSKADASPARAESFPYVIQMNSGRNYFISKTEGSMVVHSQNGTGVGWFKADEFLIDGERYSLSSALESDMRRICCADRDHPLHIEYFRPKTVYHDGVPVGVIVLNNTVPEDSIPPVFTIQNVRDLQDNNFLRQVCFLLEIQSEPGTCFNLSCNGRESRVLAQTDSIAVPIWLGSEQNTIEILSTDIAGNSSSETLNIRTGGVQFNVNEIFFNACSRARLLRSRMPQLFEGLARNINELNVNIQNPKYRVTQVNIPYLSSLQFICPYHPLEVESGGTRDGWHLGQNFIYIGYGNFTQYNDAPRRLRDVYTHEFGHHMYDLLQPDDRRRIDAIYQDIVSCDSDTRHAIFNYLFHDGKYEERTDVGHPWDNASELYASVFHITTNYWSELSELLSMQNPKVRGIAQRVIDFVLEQQSH